MNPKSSISRREFIKASAAGIAAPTIIPSSALGLGRRPAPSNRVNVAFFGFGTIAHGTISGFLRNDQVQLVAVADANRLSPNYGYRGEKEGGRLVGMEIVNDYYAQAEGRLKYRGCRAYEDFRELVENEDVDAVNISTPDHWHAAMAIYCAPNRKIHVYGQKPLAVTVAEGRAMERAVRRNKITWQTGSQQRSESYFREAVEFVRQRAYREIENDSSSPARRAFRLESNGGSESPGIDTRWIELRFMARTSSPSRISPGDSSPKLATQFRLLRGHDY